MSSKGIVLFIKDFIKREELTNIPILDCIISDKLNLSRMMTEEEKEYLIKKTYQINKAKIRA